MFEGPNGSGTIPEHAHSPSVVRTRFPRGLTQPEGSFRFSSDALLLACFPSLSGVRLALDLGAGCGVIGLALLCRSPGMHVTGVDCLPEVIKAASRNARLLGFGESYTALHADLASPRFHAGQGGASPAPGSYDLAIANPPYRQRHRGRLPQSAARLTALFETASTQEDFCRAAARALKPGGRFFLAYPATREEELRLTLARHGLRPTRVLPLAPKRSRPPELLLLESAKEPWTDGPGCIREEPLTLHEADGSLTPDALAFCPFLARQVRNPERHPR